MKDSCRGGPVVREPGVKLIEQVPVSIPCPWTGLAAFDSRPDDDLFAVPVAIRSILLSAREGGGGERGRNGGEHGNDTRRDPDASLAAEDPDAVFLPPFPRAVYYFRRLSSRRKAERRNNEVEVLIQLQADFLLSEMFIDR